MDSDNEVRSDGPINQHEFEVKVFTGDEPNAGTDATVHITLYGTKGTSEPIKLKNSQTHTNKFERNQVDVFRIKLADIGAIKKIRVTHNNKGISPDWLLDKILINCDTLGLHYVFPCNNWLEKSKDSNTLEFDLTPKKSR